MRADGAWTALVSGGFDVFTRRIAALVGFQENRANRLLEEDGRASDRQGRRADPRPRRQGRRRSRRSPRGLALTPADAHRRRRRRQRSRHDPARRDRAWPCMPSRSVAAEAKVRIDHGDLTALLYLQGYRRDEFVG